MKKVNHGVNFLGLLCCAVLVPGSNHFPGVVPGSNAFASADDTNWLFLLSFFFSGFFYFVCIFMSSWKVRKIILCLFSFPFSVCPLKTRPKVAEEIESNWLLSVDFVLRHWSLASCKEKTR